VSQAFFVAGTGTDIGKTFFSSLFLAKYGKSHGFRYWKPVQTGLSESDDTQFIKKITNFDDSFFLRPIYEFRHPSSPLFSAKKENKEIDVKKLRLEIANIRDKPVLIEGAGGVFVPLAENYLSWQLIRESNLKVVLVCSTELGTINHTLLTLESLLQRFIPVVGFYMVGPKNDLMDDNIETIQKFGGTPCLGFTTFPMQKLSSEEFLSFANSNFDINRNVIESLLDLGDEFDS
jgi:dethiobiotin synthetase